MSTAPPTSTSKLFVPDSNALPIILPETKALGRVWIPFNVIERTCGVDRYLNNHPHAPSLCMLFQNDRCNSGSKCNQIHVDRAFVQSVTEALQFTAVSTCCLSHGDLASLSNNLFEISQPESIELRCEGMPVTRVPIDKIAITLFWYRFIKQKRRVLFFTPDRVCNLHQQNSCKYGVECKNVHLCRDFWAQFVASSSSAVVPPMFSTLPQPMCPNPNVFGCYPEPHFEDLALIEEEFVIPEQVFPTFPHRTSKALAIVDPLSGTEVLSAVPKAFDSPFTTAMDVPLSNGSEFKLNLPEPEVSVRIAAETTRSVASSEDGISLQKVSSSETLDLDAATQDDSKQRRSVGFTAVTNKKRSPNLKPSAVSRRPQPQQRKSSPTTAPNNGVEDWGTFRLFPSAKPKAVDQPSLDEWAEQAEACRGKFKKVTLGLLGVAMTKGPGANGFGAGRGIPIPAAC